MKVLVLIADSNGGYPVPASRGGAVSTLVELLALGNDKKMLCDLEIVTFFDEKAFEISKRYKNIKFTWIKVPNIIKLLDKCLFMIAKFIKNEKSGSYKSIFSLLFYISKAKKLINAFKGEKIIIENNIPLVRIFKHIRTNSKLYYHFHNVPRINAGCKDVMKKITAFICVSKFVSERIMSSESAIGSVPSEKIRILYNCIDTDLFCPMDKNSEKIVEIKNKYGFKSSDKIIIFTGRLSEEKGADKLLLSMQRLPENYKALIVGSSLHGSDAKSVYQKSLYTLSHELNNRVFFTGYVQHKDLPYYYNVAEVAVLPSIWDEPAGLTNLEAMACGIPVITTDAGGIPEYVGRSIILNRNDRLAESIASSVVDLIRDKNKYREISEYSRQYVIDHFDKTYYIERFIEAISK